MKTLNETLSSTPEDLMYSQEYAEFIMEHSKGDRVIFNGDSLLEAMEAGYLFDEFLETYNSGN